MRENAAREYPLVRGLNVLESDMRKINWFEVLGADDVDIVTGGPPCQPFFLGGIARSAVDLGEMGTHFPNRQPVNVKRGSNEASRSLGISI